MTSPVDTSVKHFTSAMAGAPTLSGTAGSLISLLDACLIDGFGSKTATSLVVAGGIATLTFTGGASAALVDSVILVAGSTPAGLNGEQKVLSANSTTVTFATELADQTATGTITFKMAPVGFTKAFTGTNLAAYKSSDVESTGMYLRVDDTGTTMCRVVGYETMSDVNTGTGPFPTSAQISGGGYWTKSSAANSTGNPWILIADSRMFMLWIAPYAGATPTNRYGITRAFGDFVSFRQSGDAFACTLSYSTSSGVQSQYENAVDYSSSTPGHAVARSYTGLGTCVLHGVYPYLGNASSLSGADTMMGAFPSVIDGGLRLSKRYYATATSSVPPRGELPGLYSCPQSLTADSFSWGDRIDGTGALSGRKLIALTPINTTLGNTFTSASAGTSFVDITGPWR